MKKPFKETRVGGFLKEVAKGALDTLPIPTNFFFKDKNGDNKVQLKEINYLHLGGSVALLGVLLKLGIVDFSQVLELIRTLLAV